MCREEPRAQRLRLGLGVGLLVPPTLRPSLEANKSISTFHTHIHRGIHTQFSNSPKAYLRNLFPEGGAGVRVCGMDVVLEDQLLLLDFFLRHFLLIDFCFQKIL